jgi:uncharacterized membrane protein (DUF485 family)
MKCNHCDNEAVYSEDFCITQTYMTDEQAAQQKELEKKRRRNALLFGAIGGYVLSDNNDVAPTKRLIGFVRENVCEECYNKYHDRLNDLKEKVKSRKPAWYVSLTLMLLFIFGAFLVMPAYESTGARISGGIQAFLAIGTFVSVVVCVIFGIRYSTLNKNMKDLTSGISKKQVCPDNNTIHKDLYEAGKAPLLNMENLSYNPAESFDNLCERILNALKYNSPLPELPESAPLGMGGKKIPGYYDVKSMKDDDNDAFNKKVYNKLLEYITPEKEEA